MSQIDNTNDDGAMEVYHIKVTVDLLAATVNALHDLGVSIDTISSALSSLGASLLRSTEPDVEKRVALHAKFEESTRRLLTITDDEYRAMAQRPDAG